MERRNFLNRLGAGMAALFLPETILSFKPVSPLERAGEVVRFGVVADAHKDLMPDADDRLEKFITEVNRQEVDFIVQLGDFCMAEGKNRGFLKIWEGFEGPRYHVLGNHDMDKHSKQEMLEYWGMPATFYSFDFGGVHFVVLDANFLYVDGRFIDYARSNFYVDNSLRTFISEEQIEWFKSDMEATPLPTVVFSHQSLWHYQWGVKNRLTLQKILEANSEKVICCMNGHNHIDFHHRQNDIDYIEVNSLSYQWMEDKYQSTARYPQELYQQYQWLANIAPYKDPLFAMVSIDLGAGTMAIKGVKSQWMPPSPYDLGMPKGIYGCEFSPEMSDYFLKFKR